MGPGWHQWPRTFAPQARVMAAGVRDDVGHEYTCFMHGGEAARLHEGFLRNKNAALPARAQKSPLTLSGLKKIDPGWRQRPQAFAPQASVMAAGVRDDVGHEYTCFMRGGEDARLHERFSGKIPGN